MNSRREGLPIWISSIFSWFRLADTIILLRKDLVFLLLRWWNSSLLELLRFFVLLLLRLRWVRWLIIRTLSILFFQSSLVLILSHLSFQSFIVDSLFLVTVIEKNKNEFVCLFWFWKILKFIRNLRMKYLHHPLRIPIFLGKHELINYHLAIELCVHSSQRPLISYFLIHHKTQNFCCSLLGPFRISRNIIYAYHLLSRFNSLETLLFLNLVVINSYYSFSYSNTG